MSNNNDINIADVLQLPIMANARLVAGKNGLNNKIQYVNVLDNLFNDTNTSEFLPKYGGSFYLTSLYYGTKDSGYIMQVLEHFVDVRAAAVCIIDEYLSRLPAEAYSYADSHDLPIIFIDKDTPYAVIISDIMELKLKSQEIEKHREILFSLTTGDCSEDQVKQLVYQLNPKFASHVISFHCIRKSTAETSKTIKLTNLVRKHPLAFVSEYKNGTLIIYSFNTFSEKRIEEITDAITDQIQGILTESVIGISDMHTILEIGKSINEATTASNSGECDLLGRVFYHDLGVSRLISTLNGSTAMENYYNSLMEPLKKYDDKNNSSLIDTIIGFVENNMDYVKTSKVMYIHENTIRYRLNKVKALIPYGSNELDFHFTLYLLYKIYRLKQL
jgi:purine catabolism regulator